MGRLAERPDLDPRADVLLGREGEHLPELVRAADETSRQGEVLADELLCEESRELVLGKTAEDEGAERAEELEVQGLDGEEVGGGAD